MSRPILKFRPLQLLSHDVPTREVRDRLEILEALIGAPGFDPVLRADVLQIPRDHPQLGWGCQVPECERARNEKLMCHRHVREWVEAKAAGLTKVQFLDQAVPLPAAMGTPRKRCRICPDRGVAVQKTPLCNTHYRRWHAQGRLPLDNWCSQQRPLVGYGGCQVSLCGEPAESPLGLCAGHQDRYRVNGSPGGARIPRHWDKHYDSTGELPVVEFGDEAAFRHWCVTVKTVLVSGQVSFEGLPRLLASEFKWGWFDHYQQANPSLWSVTHVQAAVRAARRMGIQSFADREDPRVADEPSATRTIFRGIRASLRRIYFTPEETKAAGFIETELFGRRFPDCASHIDLTPVPQSWLRDLLWEYMAAQLRSVKCPRSRGPFDVARRSVMQLGAFLAAAAPEADDDPTVLSEKHTEAFVADMRHREREGLPSLGLLPGPGKREQKTTIVTSCSRRMTFNGIHKFLYWSLESGHAEKTGLSRAFITAMPAGGTDPKRSRNPFSDDVARALAAQDNLERLSREFDPHDRGYRDIWEVLVFTGRRCSEVIRLRLDCTGRYGSFALLWHDQTKVGNYNEAVRIPDYLFERLEDRRQKTLARFEERHGRRPAKAERGALALFPSPACNENGRKSLSYSPFQGVFSAWVDSLDLGSAVPHQARHTMATRLLRNGASLTQIRRYLGQVSDRMAEHYAKVAASDIEDALQAIWVAGPGSAAPGELLSGDRPLSQAEAMALALDLSRRSTPAEGGFCTFQPVVDGGACPWNLDCENCDKFVLSGADLVYWRRKQQQWSSLAERAPDDATADYLHRVFEPTARAIAGLERALAGMGLLEEALSLDLRRPQDYFERVWSTAFRASDLAKLNDADDTELDALDLGEVS